MIASELNAVVMQEFIVTFGPTNITASTLQPKYRQNARNKRKI